MSATTRTSILRVQDWLTNFRAEDQDTARLLIEGLTLVSETQLRHDLDRLLTELVKQLPGPVAVFPSREVDATQSAHDEGRDGRYAMFESGLPGSEAIVANVATGVRRASKDRIVDHPDLATLRGAKVRTVLLLDDFSGSGKRLLDFDRALRRHATIRSWASYKLISFHVVLYAATDQALKRLRRRFGKDRVHVVRPCPTFETLKWTIEQRAAVEDLCIRWAKKKKPMALGFRNSRAMIAFEHTAPNNLPFILWRTGGTWKPLFEGKYVPPDLLTFYRMAPAPRLEPQPGSEGAVRVGRLLERLTHRGRTEDHVAADLDVTVKEARRLLKLVQDEGLADANLKLTDQGLVALRQWRADHPVRQLPNNDAPYYPRQLRAGR